LSLIFRYVLRSFLFLWALCFFGSVLVFLVIDFVGQSKVWLARPLQDSYDYYLNFLPHVAYLVSPIALLLAGVFSVGQMAKHHELVALRSAGMSMPRILAPILAFGVMCSFAGFFLQDRVLPDANHKRFEINEPKTITIGGDGGDPLERYEFLYTASNGVLLHCRFYSGRKKSGSGVTLLKPKSSGLAYRIEASSMKWQDSVWRIKDGIWRNFKGGDSLEAIPFKDTVLTGFVDSPEDLLDNRVHPDEMSLAELDKRIQTAQRNGDDTHLLETHKHFRYASTFVNAGMTTMGASLAVHAVRTGLARNFVVGLLVTFVYYVALRLGLVAGENGGMPPIAAAWFGNSIFLPVILLLWWRAVRF
jgi:lipopolysaccharide export system permease protein